MLLEKEKINNKASKYYRKITLLESRIFQYIIGGVVFLHVAVIVACAYNAEKVFGFDNLQIGFIAIACEGNLLYFIVRVSRADEYRFNRLVRDGIVLRATINHQLSRVRFFGDDTSIQIFSYYICEDGEKITFAQTSKLDVIAPLNIFIEKKLEKESHINVLVNPIRCSEYYIVNREIGVKREKKYEVIYGNKTVSIILLFLLLLEYIIWILYF